jgi:hypothetical protein
MSRAKSKPPEPRTIVPLSACSVGDVVEVFAGLADGTYCVSAVFPGAYWLRMVDAVTHEEIYSEPREHVPSLPPNAKVRFVVAGTSRWPKQAAQEDADPLKGRDASLSMPESVQERQEGCAGRLAINNVENRSQGLPGGFSSESPKLP